MAYVDEACIFHAGMRVSGHTGHGGHKGPGQPQSVPLMRRRRATFRSACQPFLLTRAKFRGHCT